MLSNLQNKITALQKFSFKDELIAIVEENKDKLADLQASQLYAGVDYQGNKLTLDGQGYAPFTIEQKKKKGQVTDRVTWNDTGAFYASLRIQIKGSKFSVNSNSFKFDKLKKRSGAKAIGISIENSNDFAREIVAPAMAKSFKAKT